MSMYFSFKTGIPIAVIKGGKYNNKILRLKTEEFEDNGDNINIDYPIEMLGEGFLKKNKIAKRDLQMFFDSILSGKGDIDDRRLKSVYIKAIDELKEKNGKELILDDDSLLFPSPPDYKDGYHVYSAAPTGAGKSTLGANYAYMYKQLHPKNKIFLFSRKDEDRELDKLKGIIRIKIDERLLDEDIDPLHFFRKSLVIFDDVDTIPDKELKDKVLQIRKDLLENGRSEQISVYCTSHLLCNNNQTKTSLNDSRSVVIFPKSGGGGINYFLKNYLGFNANQINKIMKLPSRWVMIKKDYPTIVLYSKGAYFP